MLRKTASILIAFTYLMLSVGVGIAMHYCGDEVTSVGLYDTDGCECGDESTDSGCCEDEYLFFKADYDQKPEVRIDAKKFSSDQNPFTVNTFADSYLIKLKQGQTVHYESPPPLIRSLFLLNHSFIFYG